jgi:hypothetical protein
MNLGASWGSAGAYGTTLVRKTLGFENNGDPYCVLRVQV